MTNTGERSFAEILESIVGNVQGIVRSEIRLAKSEIREESVKAGRAAGMLATGVLLAVYAGGFVLLTCLLALELAMAAWLAALIVAVVAGAVGAVLIKLGWKRMKRVDPRPDQTIQTVKENVEWAKHQAR